MLLRINTVTHRRRNWGGGGRAPPIFYPRDFINIHTCSANHHDLSVYYVRLPPKIKLFLHLCNRLICNVTSCYTSIGTNSVMVGASFRGDVSMWISASARPRALTALSHCQETSIPTIHQQQAYTHREHIQAGPTLKTYC